MDSSEYDLTGQSVVVPQTESLFERCHWFYALCREYLFRDHTPEISSALFHAGAPAPGTHILEIGCGPGVYACRLAEKYPQISTTGLDLSKRLIRWARSRADGLHLNNCSFREGDAQSLPAFAHSVDAVVVSRLFLIVPDKSAVLSEIFRVLRPGGRCFIAEPTSGFRTRLPLIAMWMLARLSFSPIDKFREPHTADILSRKDFSELVNAQPWQSAKITYDEWYQYAVCTKASEDAEASPLLTESAA